MGNIHNRDVWVCFPTSHPNNIHHWKLFSSCSKNMKWPPGMTLCRPNRHLHMVQGKIQLNTGRATGCTDPLPVPEILSAWILCCATGSTKSQTADGDDAVWHHPRDTACIYINSYLKHCFWNYINTTTLKIQELGSVKLKLLISLSPTQ